ncbi:hypothetical protein PVOR_02556 [Paenibacillus vortex V453]|uniref:Uncharacterized protein n=1 Tax=Paenibacillus vortex V453 TaxID=715225 RepID=A0A2R9T1F1_9BACL|nr:hypothetical protein PVOR_02556 [Paenibacillus vortex V453]
MKPFHKSSVLVCKCNILGPHLIRMLRSSNLRLLEKERKYKFQQIFQKVFLILGKWFMIRRSVIFFVC